MSTIKEDFIKALLNSTSYATFEDNKKPYFVDEYRNRVYYCMHLKSRELSRNRYGDYPFCALASSARLAFIDYYNQYKDVSIFEIPLENGIPGSPTFMDVVVGDDYYECKCQEVLNRKVIKFRESYLKSKLFKEIVPGEYYKLDKEEAFFDPKALGINLVNENKNFHFDIKQLVCHLIAIAYGIERNTIVNNPTLKYIIYKPSKKEIEREQNKTIQDMYSELQSEVDAIWSSKIIQNFIQKRKINLIKPEERFIDEIGIDFIYDKLNKK